MDLRTRHDAKRTSDVLWRFQQAVEEAARRRAQSMFHWSKIRRLLSCDMTTSPEKQWRIDNASHLKGQRLQFRQYTRWSERWDHDHCAACWAKFAEFEGPDVLHDGYATCDDYSKGACYEWVCQICFDDLKDDMEWSTVKGC